MKVNFFIVLFLLSTNAFAQVYRFTGTPSDDAADPSLWKNFSTGGTAPHFEQTGAIFDFNGYDGSGTGTSNQGVVTFQSDITIGNVTFTNSKSIPAGGSTTSDTVALGCDPGVVITIKTTTAWLTTNLTGFLGTIAGKYKMAYYFNGATWIYNSTSTQTIYNNWIIGSLELSNSDKTLPNCTIDGPITEKSGANIEITVGCLLTSQASITSTGNNTTFILNTSGSGSFITDQRSSKSFPATWKLISPNHHMNAGTYSKVIVQTNLEWPSDADLEWIISSDLDISYYLVGSPNTTYYFSQGNGSILDIRGTLTNNNSSNGVRFTCTNNLATIKISNNSAQNLYFGHPSVTNGILFKSLIFTNTTAQNIYLQTNLSITNELAIGPNNFIIGNNTLIFNKVSSTANPTVTKTGSGVIDASDANKSEIELRVSSGGHTLTFPQGIVNEIDVLRTYFRTSGSTTAALALQANIVFNNNTTINDSLVFGRIPATAKFTNIDINGNSLIINGLITYWGTANKNYCQFKGSSTSNLRINGNVTENIFFNQSAPESRMLKDFIIGGNSNTITLGNWLDITGGSSSSGFGTVDVVAASNKLYTNGYLTLKSNEYGTAMIGNVLGSIEYSNGVNTGTMLVENFIGSSGRGRQYRFLSSPVSGGIFLQWRDSLNTRNGRGLHITGDYTKTKETTGTPTPIDSFDMSTTNFPTAFEYDETKAGNTTGISSNSGAAEDAGWVRFSQANTKSIVNGKGYRILVRGDRTRWIVSGGNSTDYDPNNTTIQTRGGYVAGPITVPITNSGSNSNNGINLVGNPYACAVDWHAVYNASTQVDASYVLYDPAAKSWQAYNANSTTPSVYRYISPGQGFLVYTGNSTGGSVEFSTASKTTSVAGSRTFTEIKTNHLITRLRKDTTAADMNIIYFLSGATNYYDKYDAGHIPNEYVNLSSLDSTNTLYNINCLDSLSGQRIVPMSVYGTPKGSYTMSFDDVNSFRNHDVYLVDNFLKKTTKVDDMTQYNVDITDDKFSFAEGRFYISFEPKAASSIVTINKTDNFTISPNPVKDQININMNKSVAGNIQYEIFNINGQLISNGSLTDGESKINSGALTKGIYFMNLKSNNETQTIKFIK